LQIDGSLAAAGLDWKSALGLAEGAARAASQRLADEKAQARDLLHDLARDVKIVADRLADQRIREALGASSAFPILSEEQGIRQEEIQEQGLRWIVDPLDGSLNFHRGIPWSAVSIALWRGMTPVLGVIQDLNRPEIFTGVVGQGAWLNGRPIQVSQVRERKQAVLCTGFPVRSDFSTQGIAAVMEGIQGYKKVRWLGSAALSLAYAACGRVDAYQEEAVALWDVAAGLAIVQASGGMIRCRPTGTEITVSVRAANRFLLEEEDKLYERG
jgi:fructose-1,6-bisphosphatase/inositol monophosphatase family enzyme